MIRLSRLVKRGIIFNNDMIHCSRSLYSASSLGLDDYIATKNKITEQFSSNGDKFRSYMVDTVYLRGEIHWEDLKDMVHLVDTDENDLILLEKTLQKFNHQQTKVRFGNVKFDKRNKENNFKESTFGPVVMRLFYHTKNADLALKLFKDPAMEGFFDQLISCQILLDMLYEAGRFIDVVDVFHIVRSRQIQGEMYPKPVVHLVFAACYKENTSESFTFASNLWNELNAIGHIPMRRAAAFASMLALKHSAPHIALEIVETVRQPNYVTLRNIKLLALTELGRVDDALDMLKSMLELADPKKAKHTYVVDVIARLKEAVNQIGNNELEQNFKQIEASLVQNGHVSNKTLNQLLTNDSSTNPFDIKNNKLLTAGYNNNYNSRHRKHRRKY